MAVKIRLKRMGKRKQPVYRVVVSDSRKARSADYIEAIGFYDPRQEPSLIEIENERAVDWLSKGAQPTEAARKLLEISGAWTDFKIARGEVLTVGASPAAEEPMEEPAAEAAEPAPEAEEPTPEAAEADAEPDDEADDEADTEETSSDEDASDDEDE
ncbi:MAG: 30S ribosomal protein S16 [Acidimicrobiia bacterium]